MILWRGAGILAALIPLLVWGLGGKVLEWVFGDGWVQAWPVSIGVIIWLAGAFILFLGLKLNRKHEGLQDDPVTGQPAARKKKHAILFIPMEYAGLLWMFFGIYLAFNPQWAVASEAASTVRVGADRFIWGGLIVFLVLLSRQIVTVVTAVGIGFAVTQLAKTYGFSEKAGFIAGLAVFFQFGMIELFRPFGVEKQEKKD